MRLTKHTDYALRVLMHLGVRPDKRVPIAEVSTAFRISHHHLQKVVRSLAQAGYVDLQRGAAGGAMLSRPPAEISIGRVIRELEAADALIECFDAATDACLISPICRLKPALRVAQEAFFAALDPLSLADTLRGKTSEALFALTRGVGGK